MKKLLSALLLTGAGLIGPNVAQAHGPAWSVSFGPGGLAGIAVGFPAPVYAPVHVAPRVVYAPPVYAAPVYAPPVYHAPVTYAPPVVVPQVHHGYRPHVHYGHYGQGYRPHGHAYGHAYGHGHWRHF